MLTRYLYLYAFAEDRRTEEKTMSPDPCGGVGGGGHKKCKVQTAKKVRKIERNNLRITSKLHAHL